MKTTYTAAEMMEVALMCIQNSSDEGNSRLYCQDCNREVGVNEASMVCYPLAHTIVEQPDDLFYGE